MIKKGNSWQHSLLDHQFHALMEPVSSFAEAKIVTGCNIVGRCVDCNVLCAKIIAFLQFICQILLLKVSLIYLPKEPFEMGRWQSKLKLA